jgi:hypothetical protein
MGVKTVTTVLLAPDSYDLTDLPTVKDELNIDPSDSSIDNFLTRAIAECSSQIHKYCNRTFPLETVQDLIFPDRDAYPYQIPGGVGELQLSRWPLTVGWTTIPLPSTVASGNVIPLASTQGISVGQPVAGKYIPWGTWVTAISPDVSVTLSNDVWQPVPEGQSLTFGMAVSVKFQPGFAYDLMDRCNYLVQSQSGQLVRLNHYTKYPTLWYPNETWVTYQGGFSEIPQDLVGAALRLITGRFYGKGRDPMLKSQEQPQLGTQSYWIGTMPGVRGAFTEEILGLIDRYRVPVVA